MRRFTHFVPGLIRGDLAASTSLWPHPWEEARGPEKTGQGEGRGAGVPPSGSNRPPLWGLKCNRVLSNNSQACYP